VKVELQLAVPLAEPEQVEWLVVLIHSSKEKSKQKQSY